MYQYINELKDILKSAPQQKESKYIAEKAKLLFHIKKRIDKYNNSPYNYLIIIKTHILINRVCTYYMSSLSIKVNVKWIYYNIIYPAFKKNKRWHTNT